MKERTLAIIYLKKSITNLLGKKKVHSNKVLIFYVMKSNINYNSICSVIIKIFYWLLNTTIVISSIYFFSMSVELKSRFYEIF